MAEPTAGADRGTRRLWPALALPGTFWLIALFLVPVTLTVHGVDMVTNPDARMRAIQTSFFLKGIAMTGAALLFAQTGVQPRR